MTRLPPLSEHIRDHIRPRLRHWLEAAERDKEALVIDGVEAFDDATGYLDGTLVKAITELMALSAPGSDEYSRLAALLEWLIRFSLGRNQQTWGILYYLMGLSNLRAQGSFDSFVAPGTAELLSGKLDWRTFVDPESLVMPIYPMNYFGVATRIAVLREAFGWEDKDASASRRLYSHLVQHIMRHSDGVGYMDDSEGLGRYDVYTMALPFELYDTLVESGGSSAARGGDFSSSAARGDFSSLGIGCGITAGCGTDAVSGYLSDDSEVASSLLKMMTSVGRIYLLLANRHGHGFQYGRSLGAYGDTGPFCLEVLARLGLLSDWEMRLAYGYHQRIAAKFIDFWYDPQCGPLSSINMWSKRRRTDGYRSKDRVFAIDVELAMRLVLLAESWKAMGFDGCSIGDDEYRQLLTELPGMSFFKMSDREYKRGLAIVRSADHIYSLPMVNCGIGRAMYTPYLPIPHEHQVIEAPPDSFHRQLIPHLFLPDGSELAPICFATAIDHNGAGTVQQNRSAVDQSRSAVAHNGAVIAGATEADSDSESVICYRQDRLCGVGNALSPSPVSISSETKYTFREGVVTRVDSFFIGEVMQTKAISVVMEFVTASDGVKVGAPVMTTASCDGTVRSDISFERGPIAKLSVEGMSVASIEDVRDREDCRTSHGPMATKITWSADIRPGTSLWSASWRLEPR